MSAAHFKSCLKLRPLALPCSWGFFCYRLCYMQTDLLAATDLGGTWGGHRRSQGRGGSGHPCQRAKRQPELAGLEGDP